jgi:large subunit ribosomal protein L18
MAMFNQKNRKAEAQKRHERLRVKLSGSAERPRLSVYRSNKHIYVQIIDDTKGVTLASASSVDTELKGKLAHGGNVEASKAIGKLIAERAKAKGITQVVFDRGGNLYHGRIAAIADAAREGGIDF